MMYRRFGSCITLCMLHAPYHRSNCAHTLRCEGDFFSPLVSLHSERESAICNHRTHCPMILTREHETTLTFVNGDCNCRYFLLVSSCSLHECTRESIITLQYRWETNTWTVVSRKTSHFQGVHTDNCARRVNETERRIESVKVHLLAREEKSTLERAFEQM